MSKTGIENYCLPDRKPNKASRSAMLSYEVLTGVKSFISPKVINMMLDRKSTRLNSSH